MLPGRKKGYAAKQIGVPQRKLPLGDRLAQKSLPNVVLQHQIAKQLVVWNTHAGQAGLRCPRLELIEIIRRQEGLAAQYNRCKPNQRHQEQDHSCQDAAILGKSAHRSETNLWVEAIDESAY